MPDTKKKTKQPADAGEIPFPTAESYGKDPVAIPGTDILKDAVSLNDAYDFVKMKKRLAKKLDPKRYEHSMGVAYTAASLAMAYGEDMIKAYTAGVLHDCAKCLDDVERDECCKKYNVELTQIEKDHPFLIHAKLGAVLAKEKYGVEDPEILSAIRWHTTGRPDMTMLEAIIFSADFIEPNRKPLICLPKIRSIIFSDMDMALCLILEQTLVHLEHKGQAIDEYSMQAAEYYRNKINAR